MTHAQGNFRIRYIPPGLVQNPPTDKIRNYDTDDNSDTDSVAELEYSAWDDSCAGECQSAQVNIPPGLIQNPPTDIIRIMKFKHRLRRGVGGLHWG